MDIEYVLPQDIEARSMEIIEAELGEIILPEKVAPIVKRVIHTSADFEYARTLCFSEDAVSSALQALQQGATIVTDTNMGLMGINSAGVQQLGCQKYCFMADAEVAKKAKEKGTTRAMAAIDKACHITTPLIFAIGNAPTALLRLEEHIKCGRIKPALIIGVPVGFVNVVAAKERIMQCGVPFIVARGRKGGSPIAAAICNALIYMLTRNTK